MKVEREKPFIVKNEKAFGALKHWLSDRGCNSYCLSGERRISVGYDRRPDSDWGKYENRGFIVVCDPSLFDRTCAEIRKAYGWPPESDEVKP